MMQTKNVQSDVLSRQHGLDVVRAAAIAWVMLYHTTTMMLAPASAPWLIRFGWMGVDLFFVLSGFLIANQLLKPFAIGSRPDYRRFFVRRSLRTIPAFAAVLILYFLFRCVRESQDIQPFWQFATFTENLLVRPVGPMSFDQVWSLCVEEQFYLFFPLVLSLVAIRPSFGKVSALLICLCAGGIVLRSFLWLSRVASPPFDVHASSDWHAYVALIYYPTWSRLDGLLAGIALASLKLFRPSIWRKFTARPNLLLVGGIMGMGFSILIFGNGLPLLGVAIGFPLLSSSIGLVVASASTGRALIGAYPVVGAEALAAGAYSLYLTHKLAFHAIKKWIAPALGTSGYSTLALALAAALIAGSLLYWTVERPFLLLRERLEGASRPRITKSPSPSDLTEARHAL